MRNFQVVTPTAAPVQRREITGADLRRLVQASGPAQRALLAADLATGSLAVAELTPGQALSLSHCSAGYGRTAARLTTDERRVVESGFVRLTDYHHYPHREFARLLIDAFARRRGG